MASSFRPARPVLAVLAVVVAGSVTACGQAPSDEEVGRTTQAIETFPNEQPAFDFFLAKGLTPAQSAGIVGNLDVESGVDPTIKQNGGGPGRGIAQWSAGARWDTSSGDNVQQYATMQGESALSLKLQLEFIWFELTTFPTYGLTQLKAATSVSAATSAFSTHFEACGSCDNSQRVAYGQSVLDQFGADAPDAAGGGSSSGTPADSCTLQPSGEVGECITTSACAALGNHVSTAGLCPGANDIQCCTALDGGTSSGTTSSSGSGMLGATGDRTDSGGGGGCASTPARPRDGWWLLGAASFVAAMVSRLRAGPRPRRRCRRWCRDTAAAPRR